MSSWSEVDTRFAERWSLAEPARPSKSRNTPAAALPVKRKRPDVDDEAFDPEDDSDLGLTGLDDEDESIAADTATGFEEANDDLELPEDGEGERWSTDSDEPIELPDSDADMFPGEEYGWIGDDEPNDDDEAFDADFADDELEARDDGGEEGLEDDSELDDLDLSDLPELDTDVEEDAGAAGDPFDELAGMSLAEEPTLEVAEGLHWKVLPPHSVRVTTLGALPEAATAMVAHGSRLFVCAGHVWVAEHEARELQQLPLMAAGSSALALTEHEGALHLAVVVDGRVFSSVDAGRSFVVQTLPELATQVGFTRAGQRPRLWWLSASGCLLSPGGAANLDGRVLAFHADGARRLVALVRKKDRLQLALSTDAGKQFAFFEAPLGAGDPSTRLSVCRDTVLLYNVADVQCALPPRPFGPVSALSRGPAALANEDDEAFVYSCVRSHAGLLIVRRAARASGAAPTVVATLSNEQGGEPQLLAASYAEGGAVTLYLARQSALLRIDASLDGEELA
jgi:hypothetical protein